MKTKSGIMFKNEISKYQDYILLLNSMFLQSIYLFFVFKLDLQVKSQSVTTYFALSLFRQSF